MTIKRDTDIHDDDKLDAICSEASNYYCMHCREPNVVDVAKLYAEHLTTQLQAQLAESQARMVELEIALEQCNKAMHKAIFLDDNDKLILADKLIIGNKPLHQLIFESSATVKNYVEHPLLREGEG